jgi:hypothetical protein
MIDRSEAQGANCRCAPFGLEFHRLVEERHPVLGASVAERWRWAARTGLRQCSGMTPKRLLDSKRIRSLVASRLGVLPAPDERVPLDALAPSVLKGEFKRQDPRLGQCSGMTPDGLGVGAEQEKRWLHCGR